MFGLDREAKARQALRFIRHDASGQLGQIAANHEPVMHGQGDDLGGLQSQQNRHHQVAFGNGFALAIKCLSYALLRSTRSFAVKN